MKLNKFVILLGVVVVAALAFIMSSEKTSEKVTGVADDKKIKVGFVYLTTPGDHGWTYAHEVGRQDVIALFGDKVETAFVKTSRRQMLQVIRDLAKQDNDIIFTTSFGYMDPTLKVAKEFPETKFDHITGASGRQIWRWQYPFMKVICSRQRQPCDSEQMAILRLPYPVIIQGINAFGLGLRSVNKDAEVSVIWVNTWYDPVKKADAAKVHIAEGADILAQHTDSPAMLQTAEKAGVYGFGQSSI